MRIIHRLLFIALILPATAVQATGTEDGNAPSAPRFKIEIAGSFDYSPSKLTGNHSVITSPDGVVESDLTATKEDLHLLNRRNTYKLEQQTVDLRLSYRIYKQLHVWAGVGVVSSSACNRYTDSDEEVRSKSVSENPEFLLKGGLSYTHPLRCGFFVALRPAVAYSHDNNTLLKLYPQEGENNVYSDFGMSRKVIRWEVPLIVGKQIGRFTPYAGVAYKDFRQTDRLETESQYIDQMYRVEATDTFRSRSKIHGLAGTTFSLASNIGIGLTASFSRSIAAELTFHLSL